jgi:hypothetical protein
MVVLLAALALAPLAAAADVTGAWIFEVTLDAGTGTPSFEFKQDGEKLTGKYMGMFGEAPLTGTVKGDWIRFQFKLSQGGESIEVTYEGVIQGDSMKGKADYSGMASGTWTAKRK